MRENVKRRLMRFGIDGAPAVRVLFSAICVVGLAAPACAQSASTAQVPAIQVSPPLVSSTAVGNRIAILITPTPGSSSARATLGQVDEQIYRNRLREIGFEVRTVSPASRFDLDKTLRDIAHSVPPGSEIAVMLLGDALSLDGDIRIVPADASSDLAEAPDRLEAETLRLSDFLRRIASRLPRNLVVVVDECSELNANPRKCRSDVSIGTSGASIFSAYRRPRSAVADRTLANPPSIRANLLPLVTRDGMTFAQLQGELSRQLSGSNLALDATEPLSEQFTFLPRGFFAGVSHACNQVDPSADANLIRSVDLSQPQAACERAVNSWPYATHFADRLAAVKEQRAYQRAIASCNDPTAQSAFDASFPSSRFRPVVAAYWQKCARELEDQDRLRRDIAERERQRLEAEDRARQEAQRLERQRVEDERLRQEAQRLERELERQRRQPTRTPQQAANNFLERYYFVSSSAGEAAGARLGDLFAPLVNFYGQQRTGGQIVSEKIQYNARWPGRRFSLRPGTISTICESTGTTCRVTGMVEFDFESAQRNAHSRGLSSFEFVFTNVMTAPVVLAESSKVEQRF